MVSEREREGDRPLTYTDEQFLVMSGEVIRCSRSEMSEVMCVYDIRLVAEKYLRLVPRNSSNYSNYIYNMTVPDDIVIVNTNDFKKFS